MKSLTRKYSSPTENINDIFGYNVYTRNDKPTNGEFIALIADKLMLENAA